MFLTTLPAKKRGKVAGGEPRRPNAGPGRTTPMRVRPTDPRRAPWRPCGLVSASGVPTAGRPPLRNRGNLLQQAQPTAAEIGGRTYMKE